MIRLIAEIEAKPGQEAALRAALTALVAPTRAEVGCVAYDLHVEDAAPARFVFQEVWRDRGALAAHGKTAHIAAVRAVAGDLSGGVAVRFLTLVE
jgi:quinol monooxygenase YgiN